MINYPVETIEEVDDIESINMYNVRLSQGYAKRIFWTRSMQKGEITQGHRCSGMIQKCRIYLE